MILTRSPSPEPTRSSSGRSGSRASAPPSPAGARFLKDTVTVGPGERWDVIWTARRPGKWLLHCHIPHHTTNDNVEEDGGGGLMTIIDVRRN